MKQIAYITDIHLDEKWIMDNGVQARENWQLILEDVAKKNITEIIIGGDVGEKESNAWFFGSLKKFKLNITPGNHDHFDEIIKYYSHNSGNTSELFSSFEDDHLKYIFLDSSSEEIGNVQFEWLKDQLITKKKIIIFIHHPVLGVDTAVDKQYPLRGRDKIKRELQSCKNEIMIFCGHYHMNDERTSQNITQFITPSAALQIKKNPETFEFDNSTFGYRIINFDTDKVTSRILLFKDGQFV